MKLSKPDYLKAVRTELENIKKYATQDQIDELNIKWFNPQRSDNCIYGQMAGDCHNDEAVNLIRRCSVKYSIKNIDIGTTGGVQILDKISKIDYYKYDHLRHFSLLERFVFQHPESNKSVINFLKNKGNLPDILLNA